MLYIVFGVSGIGKTTIGVELSKRLQIPFFDADDYHPEDNIQKMKQGIPLNDSDREPWLETLSKHLNNWNKDTGAVLACSALKESYRVLLGKNIPKGQLKWVFLNTDFNTIQSRINSRKGHFMKSALLKSQFDALEIPQYGIHVNANNTVASIINQIMNKINHTTNFGLIGLGVMGKSLALNIANNNFSLSVYNRHVDGKEEHIASDFIKSNNLVQTNGFDELKLFVESLQQPRNILLMVNAGKTVDFVIDDLLPFLDADDLIIDGGNSHFLDTKRRIDELKNHGIHYIGMGVSGGEEGALKGPSIMPGGNKEIYPRVAPILEKIAAKDKNNNPCCAYVGEEGSGHFIKTIHNGIEYAEMQLIAELYHALRFHQNMLPEEIALLFKEWQNDGLDSFLLEISIDILTFKEANDTYLIDNILDKASQKGTGGWSTNAALDLGKPLDTIAASVMARLISAMKEVRLEASNLYQLPKEQTQLNLVALKNCYATSRIINHAIGFDCILEASNEYNWNLNLSEIARIWTNGCIIRSELMEDLVQHFKDFDKHLLLNKEVAQKITPLYNDFKNTVSTLLNSGCSIPVLSTSLNYFLGFTSSESSANMIQAQRDYFGAHTYQRIDKPEDQYFHTQWKKSL